MFKRMDEIMIEIPEVEKPDPNAAAAVQELLGEKFEEMLYTWSDSDFGAIDQIWKGTNPEDNLPLESFKIHLKASRSP